MLHARSSQHDMLHRDRLVLVWPPGGVGRLGSEHHGSCDLTAGTGTWRPLGDVRRVTGNVTVLTQCAGLICLFLSLQVNHDEASIYDHYDPMTLLLALAVSFVKGHRVWKSLWVPAPPIAKVNNTKNVGGGGIGSCGMSTKLTSWSHI
jgi:hypothetical protein